MKYIFSFIAGALYIVGFIPYIRAILHKQIKPAKTSWIIWASLDTITIAGMYAKDSINGQIIGAITGAWIVVIFVLKFGTPGWSKLDIFCLSGAIIGVTLWQLFDNPMFGIIISLVIVFLGSVPTFVSAWKNPSHEDKLTWTIFWFSCIFAMIAIPQWTLADAAQPLTFFIIESIMIYLLYFHTIKRSIT